jgi:hypothetical protein
MIGNPGLGLLLLVLAELIVLPSRGSATDASRFFVAMPSGGTAWSSSGAQATATSGTGGSTA